MTRQIHMCMSIAGALRMTPKEFDRAWDGCVTDDDGKPMSTLAFREHLKERRNAGEKYFPLAECDNFDPQTGCRGHEIDDDETQPTA